MITTSEFRNGAKLELAGEPFTIIEFQHVKPGKGGAFVRTKLKSLRSGNVIERTYRSGEKLDTPDLEELEMKFLYAAGDQYTFMDTTNYEQLTFDKGLLGGGWDLLKEDMTVKPGAKDDDKAEGGSGIYFKNLLDRLGITVGRLEARHAGKRRRRQSAAVSR